MRPFFAAALITLMLSHAGAVLAAPEGPGRLSAQAMVGVNPGFPTYEFQVGYRLPFAGDRFEPVVLHSPWNTLSTGASFSTTQLGLRTYLGSSESGGAYALAAAGVFDHTATGRGPAISLGLGSDWMYSRWVGLSGSLVLYNMVFVRPMVGLRISL